MSQPNPETFQRGALRLDTVDVKKPCPMSWEKMQGTEQSRYCGECKLFVHNLSAMTREDAEAFLQRRAGRRSCIRFYRRADGKILTQDCTPIRRRKLRWLLAVSVGFFLMVLGNIIAMSPGFVPNRRGLITFRETRKLRNSVLYKVDFVQRWVEWVDAELHPPLEIDYPYSGRRWEIMGDFS